MKTYAGRQFDTYEQSGRELRIHWNIIDKGEGQFEASEALVDIAASRSQIIEAIISSEYSTGRELATINNRDDDQEAYAEYQAFRTLAKALADGWINREQE